MTIQQWANEIKEILEYFYGCECSFEFSPKYEYDCFFKLETDEKHKPCYVVDFNTFNIPLYASLYLTIWFGKLEIPF